MKKLLNVMLATFLVFTVISFAVSAEDGATNEGSVAVATGNEPGQVVNFNCYQDANGDLIIKASKEKIDNLLKGFTGTGDWKDTRLAYYIGLKNDNFKTSGAVGNKTITGWGWEDKPLVKVDDNTLKVAKSYLAEHGFVDGEYTVSYNNNEGEYNKGTVLETFDTKVKLVTGVQPNVKTNLTLVGNIVKPQIGGSTKLNKNDFKLVAEDGTVINSDDWRISWVKYDPSIDLGGEKYFTSVDMGDTFVEGGIYRINVVYNYISSGKDEKIALNHSTYKFGEVRGEGLGATGGDGSNFYSYLDSDGFICLGTEEFTPAKKPVPISATENKGDVKKEFTTPTGNFMSFNVTSVEPEANAEVIAKIEAGNVTPEVKTLKKDEKSVTFSVKPIDTTSATKEELDTKGIWVTFSINVKGVFAEGTKVRVLHYKDGETEACETLEGVVDGSGDIVLSTKKGFSTFRVVEAPKASNTTSSTKPAGVKDTNGDGVISCDEEMGSKNWIWSETKKACVYKVSNTSVK